MVADAVERAAADAERDLVLVELELGRLGPVELALVHRLLVDQVPAERVPDHVAEEAAAARVAAARCWARLTRSVSSAKRT